MKRILLAALMSGAAFAKPLDGVPATGAAVEAFVPKGWAVESKTPADLNGDGLEDVVLVIVQQGEGDRARGIVWLHAVKGAGFQRIDTNQGVLACVGCLGMKGGDAAPEIEVKKNVVSFSQYGGSRESYGSTHRFRFEKAGVRLIGLDKSDMDTLTGESSSTSENLLTGLVVSEKQPPETDENGKPTGLKATKKTTKGKAKKPVFLRDAKGYGE